MRSTIQSTLLTGLPARLAATLRRFAADTTAATAIEYAVMTFIAVAIVAVVSQVGTSVTALYVKVEGIFN